MKSKKNEIVKELERLIELKNETIKELEHQVQVLKNQPPQIVYIPSGISQPISPGISQPISPGLPQIFLNPPYVITSCANGEIEWYR